MEISYINNIFGLFFAEPKDRKALIESSINKYRDDISDKEMEFLKVFLITVLDHCNGSIKDISDNKLNEKTTTYYVKKVCYYAEDIFRLLYELYMSGEGYNHFFSTSNVDEAPGKLIVKYLEEEMKELKSVNWYELSEKDGISQSIVLLANSDSGQNINNAIDDLRDVVTKEEIRELEKIVFGYNPDSSMIDEYEYEPFDRIITHNKRVLDMRDTYIPGLTYEKEVPDGKISVEFNMHKTRDHKDLLSKLVKAHLRDSKWYKLWKSAANDSDLRAEASITCNYIVGAEIAEEIKEDLEKIGELLYELTAYVNISYPPGGIEDIALYDDHGGFFAVSMNKGGMVSIDDVPII